MLGKYTVWIFSGLVAGLISIYIWQSVIEPLFAHRAFPPILLKDKYEQYNFTSLRDLEVKANLLDECDNQNCIVHFWASWCESCRHELLDLDDLQNIIKLNKLSVKTFSIAYKDKREDAQKLVSQLKIKEESWFNTAAETEKNFSITGVPETLFLKGGRLVHHIKGPLNFAQMRSMIKKVF